MNILIFDTETTSLEKPFCYNIGYVIADTETEEILVKRDFVVEQVWHNPMLFTTAYYADKREIYVASMRKRSTKMDKFGYICQQMIRDIKAFDIIGAYDCLYGAFCCMFLVCEIVYCKPVIFKCIFEFNIRWQE